MFSKWIYTFVYVGSLLLTIYNFHYSVSFSSFLHYVLIIINVVWIIGVSMNLWVSNKWNKSEKINKILLFFFFSPYILYYLWFEGD